MKRYDLTNQKFGRLTVISKAPSMNARSRWICRCECGNTKEVLGQNLRNGHVKSCGCLKSEIHATKEYKHGFHGTRLYRIYIGMIGRCHNPSVKAFKNYGAKGITVCEEWFKNPKGFCEWSLANGYNDSLTIDRIDPKKGYSPENCRWVNYSVQNYNKILNSNNSSGFKGVSYNKRTKKFKAYITRNKKTHHLGFFDTAEEAYEARKKAALKLWDDLN